MVGSDDRGQAYTLESLVAALLIVTAVLFALQSTVITPTSAGALDRDVEAERERVATDALVGAASEGELSRLARYWDCSTGEFATDVKAGAWVENQGYADDIAPVEHLGEALNHTFDEGTRYNLHLRYTDSSGDQNVTRIVHQGTPGSEVVSTSYTITLTDGQQVTGPASGPETLSSCSDPAIPEHPGMGSSTVYNVVEVRLVLW